MSSLTLTHILLFAWIILASAIMYKMHRTLNKKKPNKWEDIVISCKPVEDFVKEMSETERRNFFYKFVVGRELFDPENKDQQMKEFVDFLRYHNLPRKHMAIYMAGESAVYEVQDYLFRRAMEENK